MSEQKPTKQTPAEIISAMRDEVAPLCGDVNCKIPECIEARDQAEWADKLAAANTAYLETVVQVAAQMRIEVHMHRAKYDGDALLRACDICGHDLGDWRHRYRSGFDAVAEVLAAADAKFREGT